MENLKQNLASANLENPCGTSVCGGGRNLLINKIKRPLRAKAHTFLGAFTLAEVLVTLTILGILASIIVPNVIQQYQKSLNISRLKNAYSTLETAAANLAVSTGCVGRDVECAINAIDEENLVDSLHQQMGFKEKGVLDEHLIVYQLYCEKQKCGPSPRSDGRHYLSKNNAFLRANGIKYFVNVDDATVTKDIDGIPQVSKTLLFTIITENSKAKRVVAGRNYFEFIMYDNFIVEPIKYCFGSAECPMSYTGIRTIDTDYCNVNEISYNSGRACAEKIVKDGWKMNY